MQEKYYFPEYALEQLNSKDKDVWVKPIRVWKSLKEKGGKAFYKAVLSDNAILSEVVERGYYYPLRDQNLEATIESFEKLGQLSLEGFE